MNQSTSRWLLLNGQCWPGLKVNRSLEEEINVDSKASQESSIALQQSMFEAVLHCILIGLTIIDLL